MAFLIPTCVPLHTQRTVRGQCFVKRAHTHLRHTRRRRSTIQTLRSALEPLVLSEDAVQQALTEVEEKLGSVFGTSAENRDVGITGRVELASLDGPIVVLRLTGRFWHKREDVFARVSAYLQERIPEICDLEIESPDQLDDADPQPQ